MTATMTDPVARAQERLKTAVAQGRGIKRAHDALGRARGKVARDAQRVADQAKAAREVARDRDAEQERKSHVAADKIEKRLRETETPVVVLRYGGKAVTISLGHRE